MSSRFSKKESILGISCGLVSHVFKYLLVSRFLMNRNMNYWYQNLAHRKIKYKPTQLFCWNFGHDAKRIRFLWQEKKNFQLVKHRSSLLTALLVEHEKSPWNLLFGSRLRNFQTSLQVVNWFLFLLINPVFCGALFTPVTIFLPPSSPSYFKCLSQSRICLLLVFLILHCSDNIKAWASWLAGKCQRREHIKFRQIAYEMLTNHVTLAWCLFGDGSG